MSAGKVLDTKLIMIIMGAVVVHLAIAIVFLLWQGSISRTSTATMDNLKSEWSFEDTQRKVAHEEELISKYGADKLDRIIYDPRLDIQLVLEKLFQEVLPEEYIVEVSVDRFTEFKVYVNVFNMPQTEQLAEAIKKVFSKIDSKYVYQIIFTDGDHYWVIDTEQLERVGNWESASIDRIRKYCFR